MMAVYRSRVDCQGFFSVTLFPKHKAPRRCSEGQLCDSCRLGGHGFRSGISHGNGDRRRLGLLEVGRGAFARHVLRPTQIDERLATETLVGLRLAELIRHEDQLGLVTLQVRLQVIDHRELADVRIRGISLLAGEPTVGPNNLGSGTTDTTRLLGFLGLGLGLGSHVMFSFLLLFTDCENHYTDIHTDVNYFFLLLRYFFQSELVIDSSWLPLYIDLEGSQGLFQTIFARILYAKNPQLFLCQSFTEFSPNFHRISPSVPPE
jgi:hypothetical protein